MTLSAHQVRAINEKQMILAKRKVEAERNEMSQPFQALADRAFNECGLGPAPRRRAGDTPATHSRAVLDELLGAVSHLPTLPTQWRGFNPQTLIDKPTIDAMAPIIFADAVKAVNATGPGSGPERVIEKRDDAGRNVRTFAGDFDPWAPFKAPTKYVTSWTNDGARGRNAAGALQSVAPLMSNGTAR